MANKRVEVWRLKECIRLSQFPHVSQRTIARSVGLSREKVADCIARAKEQGLSWNAIEGMKDSELEVAIYPEIAERRPRRDDPAWPALHLELKKPGTTLEHLHAQYLKQTANAMQRSHFYARYSAWRKTLKSHLRPTHAGGEKVFIGTIRLGASPCGKQTHLFAGVLGASLYVYAEPFLAKTSYCWLGASENMLRHLGAAPKYLVLVNHKHHAGVSFNSGLLDERSVQFARKYDIVLTDGTATWKRDRYTTERHVAALLRWFRLHVGDSAGARDMEDLRRAVGMLSHDLNSRPFGPINGNRLRLFENSEKPWMRPLPTAAGRVGVAQASPQGLRSLGAA